MNGNLAYWQLDFTVESQANLASDYMVRLCRKNSRAFGSLGGPQTPGLLYSTAFGRVRPMAHHYFQIFSSRPGLIPVCENIFKPNLLRRFKKRSDLSL